jgi:molybdate transport system substrate-binding protein
MKSSAAVMFVAIMLGCARQDAATENRPKSSISLFAAASTGEALDDIAASYEKSRRVRIERNYTATSTLAQQIELGAGAHVFLSASEEWADRLDRRGFVAQRRALLGNRLVVVAPIDSNLAIDEPSDLAASQVEHLALADPEAVPAGVYAKRTLTKLDLWDDVAGKVVTAEDVRQVLSFVETGAAAAGIVYATDAAASARVRVAFQFSPDATGPIVYEAILLKTARGDSAAESFYNYLRSPDAADIFRKRGFVVFP